MNRTAAPDRPATPDRPADRPRDEGSALLLVVGVMSALVLLVSAGLGYALQTQGVAQQSRATNQALAAAQSGIDDYLARLNRDENYWLTVDCTNPALRGPSTGTNSCGWGSGTSVGWASVPGSDPTPYPSEFHYDVEATTTSVNGTLSITSTGRAGGTTRSVTALLRRDGFGEFLYFTVYETPDPATYPNPTEATDRCEHYFWEPSTPTTKPRDLNYCGQGIVFAASDVLEGPVHSNDSLLIAGGATFKDTVTTADPSCNPGTGAPKPAAQCYRANDAGTPNFQRGIGWRGELPLPDSNDSLRKQVTPGQTNNLGCLYTGPTRIRFLAPAAGGTPLMRVWSRWSTAATLNPGCGSAADLQGAGATVAVPDNKLILVQNVPSGQSSPASGPCAAGSIGDGLPLADDWNRLLGEYNCRQGTVYVEGALKGRVTIAADNNVVVTDDLTYAGGLNGTDTLGLIASNSVAIYHPIKRTDTNGSITWSDLPSPTKPDVTVHAAVLTLKHSFTVQTWQEGARLGTLTLFGSIGQKFRGPVGYVNTTGYVKNYRYDARLKYSPPPYFLDPVKSSWALKSFGEVSPRYRTP